MVDCVFGVRKGLAGERELLSLVVWRWLREMGRRKAGAGAGGGRGLLGFYTMVEKGRRQGGVAGGIPPHKGSRLRLTAPKQTEG